MCTGAIDRILDRDEVVTLEMFSDGYLEAPAEVTVAAWEEAHANLEARDFPPHRKSGGGQGVDLDAFLR